MIYEIHPYYIDYVLNPYHTIKMVLPTLHRNIKQATGHKNEEQRKLQNTNKSVFLPSYN